jgi:hypothetical protein
MRFTTSRFIALALALVSAAAPVLAHHSFAAQYDSNKPITFTGTITKMQWQNPHIYFYVDVKDASGKVTNYAVEGGPPNTLYRSGWRKDSLKIGESVTVDGSKARDGSNLVNARSVVMANGKKVFAGSSENAAR